MSSSITKASAGVPSFLAPQIQQKPADTQPSITSLYDNTGGSKGSEIQQGLRGACRRNAVGKADAARTLSFRNMTADATRSISDPVPQRADPFPNSSVHVQNRLRSDAMNLRSTEAEKPRELFVKYLTDNIVGELQGKNLSDDSVQQLFMRSNSSGTDQIGQLMKATFLADIDSTTGAMATAFKKTLSNAGAKPSMEAVEGAVIATHKELLGSLQSISCPPIFIQIAKSLASGLDEISKAQIDKASPDVQKKIKENVAAIKATIIPAMILRTLFADLSIALSKSELGGFKNVMSQWRKEFTQKEVKKDATGTIYGTVPKPIEFSTAAMRHLNSAKQSVKNNGLIDQFDKYAKFLDSAEGNSLNALLANPEFDKLYRSLF